MGDRREEIYNYHASLEKRHLDAVKKSMDEYMKECVLEAFEYVVKNTTGHSIDENGNVQFKYKGEWLSKEQLFENFL